MIKFLTKALGSLSQRIAGDQLTKNILKSSSVIFLGSSASSVLGIVSFVILAKALGAEYLAFFALAQVYVLIINAIFNIQTWESLIKFASKAGDSANSNSIIKTNIILDFLSAIVAFAGAYLLLKPVSSLLNWEAELLDITSLYIYVIPFTLTTLTIGIPRLYKRFALIAKVQFGMALLKLIFVFTLSQTEGDLIDYISVYMIAEILINLILIISSFLLLKQKIAGGWFKSKFYLEKDQLRFLWWTNLRSIVRIPVRHLDLVIIYMVISVETVGIYKVYKEIIEVINRLSDPVNQALYPEYSKLIGNNRISNALYVTRKLMQILGAVSIAITLIMLLSAEYAVGYFFGDEYLVLIWALYSLILLTGLNLFLTPINSLFISAGFARYSFYIVLFTNIIYLAILYYGGLMYGIVGVVLAFAVQIILNKAFKIYFLAKYSSSWNDIIR
ncbi:MAG: O-antigen/teichoic acid export membrane protein [Paraglaciecola sp.]